MDSQIAVMTCSESNEVLVFDCTKSTQQNYSRQGIVTCEHYIGEFSSIRESLDSKFHGCYRKERQLFQDSLIRELLTVQLSGAMETTSRWICFTSGAMGAGKGYCMNWMMHHGVIPKGTFACHIDPDAIKRKLPEWSIYLQNNPQSAGSFTHSESALIAEIAKEAALGMGLSVWVDGSLSNTDWTIQDIQRIRRTHIGYRIAVFHVMAEEEIVLQRCRKRAISTGRMVPIEKTRVSIEGSAITVQRLGPPLVDFVAKIRNDGGDPVLLSINNCNVSDWKKISEYFM
jgi:hypothetical protein